MKPMLACSKIPKLSDIKYPCLVSGKYDGIRCLIINGKPYTRSLKPIPNDYIRETLTKLDLPDFDGELLLLPQSDFNATQSAVMSKAGTPRFTYAVFDLHSRGELGLMSMMDHIKALVDDYPPSIVWVYQMQADDATMLDHYHDSNIRSGFEGSIVKDPNGRYKYGRSTAKEGLMLKLKNFNDSEALIVGCTSKKVNNNIATTDNLGNAERSKRKAGLVETETLGSFQVKWEGKEFSIGSGFTEHQRKDLWERLVRRNYVKYPYLADLKLRVKFKYQELSAKGIPRFPTFLCIRDDRDIS